MFEGMTAEDIWTLVGLWAFFSAVVALIASSRGRSQWQWFGWAFLLSPLPAFIVLSLEPNLKPRAVKPEAPPCPRCQTPRVKGQRHCPGCGLDLWADYDAKRV